MATVIETVSRIFREAGRRLDYLQDLTGALNTLFAPADKKLGFLSSAPLRGLLGVLARKDKRYRFCFDWVELTGCIPLGDMTDQNGKTRFYWLVADPKRMRKTGRELHDFLVDATPEDARSRIVVLTP